LRSGQRETETETEICLEVFRIGRTGTTAGIGKETARVLAKRGGHIIIAVRNIKKGEAVKEEILKETPSAPFDVLELDVSSLASVRKFAEDFKSRDFPISILINNAGALFGKFELSQDGLEKTFATNHMGEAFQTHVCETSAIRAQNLLSGTILVQDLHKFSHHERIKVYSNIERIICVVTGLMVSFSPVDLITVCRTISVDQPSIGDHCSNCKKKR
jgi:NAD(P)-dependent dehydrogenase (short-subunit alcohol dehydrogenase family)